MGIRGLPFKRKTICTRAKLMENLTTLRDLTLHWADERGILKNGKVTTQALKLVSEVGELCDNVGKDRSIKDDIGDCLVVLTNLAALSNLTLEQCWSHAYNEIKDRKGYLNDQGNFIKEGDIDYSAPKITGIRIVPLLFLEQFELICVFENQSNSKLEFKGHLPINIHTVLYTFSDGTKSIEQFKAYLKTIGEVK